MFRSHRTSSGRRAGADRSAWWQGALVLAPLLLLTALGWRGLAASRTAALDAAREQSARGAEKLLAEWQNATLALRAEWPLPILYADPPAPAAPNEAQELFAKAHAAPPDEAREILAHLAQEHRDALTESGVPLLPLVLWAQLRNAAELSEQASIAEQLVQTVVESHPSILSADLLSNAEALLRERAGPTMLRLSPWAGGWWRVADAAERWRQDERARSALRRDPAADATASRWLADEDGALWWRDGEALLVPRAQLEAVAAALQQAGRANFPPYAAAEIELDGELLTTPPVAGELLAEAAQPPLVVKVRLTDPASLFAQQRAQTLWLSALLASALAAVLAGFWLLRRSISRERQLGELKSNFVASVSHELRAPIASMRVMAENLESGVVQEEHRRGEYHRLISEECRRLSALIDNVLDFARIEQNRKSYRFAETDLPALVQDAISLVQPRAAQRRQSITAELDAIEPPPFCDGLAVQQALINLLDNAIKFSPEEAAILVRLRARSTAEWELAVTDPGPGIPRAEQQRIFERFYRIGSELQRETQGAGIGLSIVKHIAEGHGGRVEVASEPGAGATFSLILPTLPPGAEAAE